MKKIISLSLLLIMIATFIVGCNNADKSSSNLGEFNLDNTINVVSREDGSGTRGAFIEIVGILEKDGEGNEVDNTYEEAIIQNATDAVITTVQGDEYAIGYISLGSLNDRVKALKIEGVEATSENIQNNSYKIARPFNIGYKEGLSPLEKDFLNFILSAEGQNIVLNEGYVQVKENLPEYKVGEQEGKIVVAGSTSVTPVMEKLAEAYENIHPKVSIEIQSTGSSAGIQAAIEGSADLAMASRELKDSELKELTAEVIAIDGIAIIVNKENPIEDLSLNDVKSIYIGEITTWNQLVK
ncbi:MAG: extracellular solute-binding protein [Tissierellia bacterium]|nr:extracellular solute-binding protein [Tissierellia bacterium]